MSSNLAEMAENNTLDPLKNSLGDTIPDSREDADTSTSNATHTSTANKRIEVFLLLVNFANMVYMFDFSLCCGKQCLVMYMTASMAKVLGKARSGACSQILLMTALAKERDGPVVVEVVEADVSIVVVGSTSTLCS